MTPREIEREQKLFDALYRISRYTPPEKLERTAEHDYGLSGAEAISMAYENVLQEAKHAIRGVRRPARRKSAAVPKEQR